MDNPAFYLRLARPKVIWSREVPSSLIFLMGRDFFEMARSDL